MSLCLLTFLWLGVLPGATPESSIAVSSELNIIVVAEHKGANIIVYDMKGLPLHRMKLNAFVSRVNVADGHIIFSCYSEKETPFIVSTLPDLSEMRKAKGISFYSPNIIDGKLYAFDVYNTVFGRTPFPNIACQFDVNTLKYLGESLFKVPKITKDYKYNFKDYWIFPYENGLIAFVEGGTSAYLLPKEYLVKERVAGPFQENPVPEMVPIKVPGGFTNTGPFNLTRVMTVERYHKQLNEWFQNKTFIGFCWENQGRFYISIPNWKKLTSNVGMLDDAFEMVHIHRVPGELVAAKDNRYWSVLRHEDRLELLEHELESLDVEQQRR